MYIRVLATLFVSVLCVSVPAFAQDDSDPGFEDVVSSFVGIATDVISGKCVCPETDAELSDYESCLKKQGKKSGDAFKKALKFSGESMADYKALLGDEIDLMVADCESLIGGGGEEPVEGEFPEIP